jgi:hypothetical protein
MDVQINNLKNQFVKIVESIQQIISFFEKLESKIDVIDNNVKILNNKIIKLSQEKKD